MAALSKDQVATLLRNAGFPEDKVPLMVNIASRESGLRPDAHNPNAATGDNSYGLFQINMLGNLGPARLREYADIGVKSYEDLKDPWKNVQAAKKVFDSQGLGAWTTYQSALKDPAPVLSGSGLDVFSEPRPQASAGRSNDPLVAAVTAMLGSGRIDRPDGMAMSPGATTMLEAVAPPGVSAQVAAIKALFPDAPAATVMNTASALPAQQGLGGSLSYIQGGWGPSGSTHYGPHFDIKGTDNSYFDRAALDRYVQVDGKPLSSGLTVAGGEFGASRDGGARKHTGWDYAFGDNAALTLTGGAQWLSNQISDYGDAAQFRLPDGRTFKILHGKLNRA